MVTFKLI